MGAATSEDKTERIKQSVTLKNTYTLSTTNHRARGVGLGTQQDTMEIGGVG